MSDNKPFPQLMDDRYGDRGGMKMLSEIFSAELPYDTKIENASKRFRVSRGTAVNWYPKWRESKEAK